MTAPSGAWRQRRILMLLSLGVSLLFRATGVCGNLPMVEKSAGELEELNREAVRQLVGVPRDGSVDLKAYVIMDGGTAQIRIDDAKIRREGGSPQSGKEKPAAQAGGNVCVPTRDGRIEYTEENSPIINVRPGGSNVR